MKQRKEQNVKALNSAEVQNLYGGYVDPTLDEKLILKDATDGIVDITLEKPDFKCY